jgi:hypothetical protein
MRGTKSGEHASGVRDAHCDVEVAGLIDLIAGRCKKRRSGTGIDLEDLFKDVWVRILEHSEKTRRPLTTLVRDPRFKQDTLCKAIETSRSRLRRLRARAAKLVRADCDIPARQGEPQTTTDDVAFARRLIAGAGLSPQEYEFAAL